jgi:hypothetical protein
MVGALASTKTFYGAKHALGALITIKTINVISLVITSIVLPQKVH